MIESKFTVGDIVRVINGATVDGETYPIGFDAIVCDFYPETRMYDVEHPSGDIVRVHEDYLK